MTALLIRRITNGTPHAIAEVGSALEAATPETPVSCLNWPQYPYCPKVSFRIGHIQTEIWLRFYVEEVRIRALETRIHGEVYKDSAVEFFLSFDKRNYYNFECNCIGTPHLAYGPARENRTSIPLPLMRQLETLPSLGTQPFAEKSGEFKWTLTARIPVTCFCHHTITSLSGVQATANFYKVGSGLSVPNYLTWAPVQTRKPNYHCPEYFGDIRFE